MPKAATKSPDTKPDQLTDTQPETPSVPAQLTDTPAPVVPTQLTSPATQPDARAELKQFVAAFGAENGANWFSEGLNFADAQTKFVGKLQEQLAAKDKEIEELNTKLKSIDRGSDKALSFSSPDAPQSEQPNEFAHLGDNMSKFASGIKLPTATKK